MINVSELVVVLHAMMCWQTLLWNLSGRLRCGLVHDITLLNSAVLVLLAICRHTDLGFINCIVFSHARGGALAMDVWVCWFTTLVLAEITVGQIVLKFFF